MILKGKEIEFSLLLKIYKDVHAEYIHHSLYRHKHWKKINEYFDLEVEDEENWKRFRRNSLSKGLDDSNNPKDLHSREIVSSARKLLMQHQYIRNKNFVRVRDLILNEPEIGHPETFEIESNQMNVSTIDYAYFAMQIASHMPETVEGDLVITEIGAGYGGLARNLKLLYPQSKIVLFDLPEGNMRAAYFLSKLFPEATFLLAQNFPEGEFSPSADFTILPGWRIFQLGNAKSDVTINVRSMMEMNLEMVSKYVSEIQRISRVSQVSKTGGLAYLVNRYEKYQFRILDYGFDPYWKILHNSGLPRQPHIHELILMRSDKNRMFLNQLALRWAFFRRVQPPHGADFPGADI